MNKQLKDFAEYLLVKIGLRKITIEGYIKVVRKLLRGIGTIYPSHDQIYKFLVWMHGQNYSYSYLHNTITMIEKYMNFIGNPIQLGRQRKPKTIVKNTLSEGEITKIIFNTKSIRERAILALLSYSGIRNKELCNLRVNDVDFGNNTLRIIEGKEYKDRIVYITGECTKLLVEYLTHYSRGNSDYLFTTIRRNNKYHGNDLRKLCRVVTERAKINKRVFPYLFRHSLAMNMLNRGASILLVKDQFGHVFVESTMVYVNSSGYGIKNEYQKYAPSYI